MGSAASIVTQTRWPNCACTMTRNWSTPHDRLLRSTQDSARAVPLSAGVSEERHAVPLTSLCYSLDVTAHACVCSHWSDKLALVVPKAAMLR